MGKLLSFLGIASAEDIASLKEDINNSNFAVAKSLSYS